MYRDLASPVAILTEDTSVKRALLVGIDHYDRFADLQGCINDVRAVANLLDEHADGSPNFAGKTLADPGGITADRLRDGIARLSAPGVDVALLYFAGHGLRRNNDLVLVTSDGTEASPGVTLTEVMGSIADQRVVREVVIILDCCFSGGAAEVPHLDNGAAMLRPGISILTASRNDQPAAETGGQRGLFSTMFCGALDGGAADVLGKVSISGLYAYLSECFDPWEQRPTLKANVDRAHDLRRCAPSVPVGELRMLPRLFPTADFELPLDPSYEPDAAPAHKEHEADFAVLQRARDAKLVVPVGTPHLYYAAMESRSCRLTPLGRHYRMLAEQRRI
jgi:hypothetical protein